MMSKIYVADPTRELREARALAEYTDIREQYGENSAEETKVYAILVEIFPKMRQYRETVRSLEAGFARGEFQLLPGDLEAAKEAAKERGLKK